MTEAGSALSCVAGRRNTEAVVSKAVLSQTPLATRERRHALLRASRLSEARTHEVALDFGPFKL